MFYLKSPKWSKNSDIDMTSVKWFLFVTPNVYSYQYYVNCRHTNEVKMWSSQLWLQFKQSQIKPKKCFQGFNGIRARGLCVSAAVLHQRSYEDPYVGSRPIYWFYCTRERNETFFGLICNCLNCNHNCDDHIFTSIFILVMKWWMSAETHCSCYWFSLSKE